jgi:hypothetical protein
MSTCVFYFGGFNASQDDIDKWVRSARQQKPTIAFTGYRWESGPASWPAETVVKGSKKTGQFQWANDAIQASGAEKVYLVGHSSGCAVANALDKDLADPRIVLVALDGYRPEPDQLKRPSTQVWGAECDGVKSKNYPGPSAGRRRIYQAKNCKKLWALHFSVVNAAANDAKVRSIATGYHNCEANLEFLS